MLHLHIGRGKSGSTTLQQAASVNRERLREAGVVYPGGNQWPTSHAALARAFRQDAASDAAAQMQGLLAQHAGVDLLLSSERFLNLPEPAVERVRSALVGTPTQIIVYLRPYPEWIVSRYGHDTRVGRNAADIDTYCRTAPVSALAKARSWGMAFGWDRCRIRSLVPDDLSEGRLIDDLLDALGVDVPITGPWENVSPPWPVTEALRWCAARRGVSRQRNAEFVRSMRPIAALFGAAADECGVTGTPYLDAAWSGALAARFDEDMAALGECVGRDFPPAVVSGAPRTFVPSAGAIPPEVYAGVRRRLAASDHPPFKPGARDLLEALLREQPRAAPVSA